MDRWQHDRENENDSGNQAEVNEWIRFGMRLGVSAALHPFEYSKVLIQLGYEPIAATPGKTLFGTRTLILPNIFEYAGHIRRIDGFFGLYRGLTPKLLGSIVGSICSERIVDAAGLNVPEPEKTNIDLTEEEEFQKFQAELKRDLAIHVSGIFVTQPFHVISVRMMAQFIGRETQYTSIFGSLIEIYRNEGIFGFFSGLIPKLICDVACVVLTSTTVYLANKYIIRDKDGRSYFGSFTQFVYASILYPLQVVSTCICVAGSGLNAGKPPYMPVYDSWIDCWNDLQGRGELKRGSSLFWRSTKSKSSVYKNSFVSLPTISKYNKI